MKPATALNNFRVTAPAQVLSRCQNKECESRDVFKFDGDVFCHVCGWNSIETHVGAQIDDHIQRWKQGVEKTPWSLEAPAPDERGLEALFATLGVA